MRDIPLRSVSGELFHLRAAHYNACIVNLIIGCATVFVCPLDFVFEGNINSPPGNPVTQATADQGALAAAFLVEGGGNIGKG